MLLTGVLSSHTHSLTNVLLFQMSEKLSSRQQSYPTPSPLTHVVHCTSLCVCVCVWGGGGGGMDGWVNVRESKCG